MPFYHIFIGFLSSIPHIKSKKLSTFKQVSRNFPRCAEQMCTCDRGNSKINFKFHKLNCSITWRICIIQNVYIQNLQQNIAVPGNEVHNSTRIHEVPLKRAAERNRRKDRATDIKSFREEKAIN